MPGDRLPSGAVCVVEHKAYPDFELNGNRWEMCHDDLDVFFGGSVDVVRETPEAQNRSRLFAHLPRLFELFSFALLYVLLLGCRSGSSPNMDAWGGLFSIMPPGG